MVLRVASLNSGSNGNCYWFSAGNDAILIDAGLSCKEIEKRIDRLGLSMDAIKAVLITHEHSDHVFGINGLLRKYDLTLYVTDPTRQAANLRIKDRSVVAFRAGETLQIGELTVKPFRTRHDAADPHGFIVGYQGVNAGVFTDIGKVCNSVKRHFSECSLAILECNYEEELLENGTYPRMLKERISGGLGHLSNRQAANLARQHRSPSLTHILAAHLSGENNTPEHVLRHFVGLPTGITVHIAQRHCETPIFEIHPTAGKQLMLF